MMKPIDVACPFCAAQPGDPCSSVQPAQFVRDICAWHAERVDAALFLNSLEDRAANPSSILPVTDAEIEQTGLI